MGGNAQLPTVFTASITTNAKLSDAYDLGKTWERIYLQVPATASFCITATCNIGVNAALTSAATFYAVHNAQDLSTATTGTRTFLVPITASNCFYPLPTGFRHVKLELANTATVTVDFKIICSD